MEPTPDSHLTAIGKTIYEKFWGGLGTTLGASAGAAIITAGSALLITLGLAVRNAWLTRGTVAFPYEPAFIISAGSSLAAFTATIMLGRRLKKAEKHITVPGFMGCFDPSHSMELLEITTVDHYDLIWKVELKGSRKPLVVMSKRTLSDIPFCKKCPGSRMIHHPHGYGGENSVMRCPSCNGSTQMPPYPGVLDEVLSVAFRLFRLKNPSALDRHP